MKKEHYAKTFESLNERLRGVGPEELPRFLLAHRAELIRGPRPFAAYMLGSYYAFLERFDDFEDKIDAMDEDELTTAELAYYLDVTARVSKKLLGVIG